MAKKSKNIDLLFGELYAHCERKGETWYGIPVRQSQRISGEIEFLTRDGIKKGEAQFCTRIWDKYTLMEYKDLRDEAQRK